MQARRRSLLLAALLSFTPLAGAKDKTDDGAHRFAVIGNTAAGIKAEEDGEARLKQALADSS